MANQAIALQSRAPQGNFLAPAIQQGAQFINMMSQQRAAERQAAAQQQQLDIARAAESRAVAEEGRKGEEFKTKSASDAIKVGMDFNAFINTAAANANSPDQFRAFAERIASVPQFQTDMFKGALSEVVASMPNDPAQFPEWKRQTGIKTIEADKRYKREFIKQDTGTGTRQLAVDPYGDGSASVVPGSEVDFGQEITYVKGPNGEVIPMPKRMAPAGGGLVGGARGGGAPLGAGIEQAAQQLSPGVIVSGRARTPERNAQVGGVPGSYHMSDNARDFQPAKGQTVAALAKRLEPLKAQGYDVIAEGDHVHVEPGPRMGRAPAAGGGVQFGVPVPGTGGKPKDLTVQEQTSSYNISRLLRGAAAIKKAVETSPSANVPGATEAVVGSLPFISGAVNFTRGPQRQIVAAAQRDVLDALLYLATGAAYNKEQLEGQMESYIPAFSDAPEAIESKRERLAQLVMDAKTRAGRAWTPKLDEAANTLFGPTAAAAPPAAPAGKRRGTPTGVDTNNPLLKG